MPLKDMCSQVGLDVTKMPRHVAIVMDGNGRWAKKRHMPRTYGHKEGAEALRKTIKACVEFGVEYLTVYVFSTENWKRPEDEVGFLMDLFRLLIAKEIPTLNQEGVKVRCLGDIQGLHFDVQDAIRKAEEMTSKNSVLQLNLMLNYGARHEILQACRAMLERGKEDVSFSVSQADFESELYTSGIPDPEILVRTGGDVRVSNYLLWQIAYSELFFLETLWPDFNRESLIEVLKQFQNRERRFGGLSSDH